MITRAMKIRRLMALDLQMLPPRSNTQCHCHRVEISGFQSNWLLNELILHSKPDNSKNLPHLPLDMGPWPLVIHNEFMLSLQESKILVVRMATDRRRMALNALVLIAISPFASALAGHFSHNAMVGIAICAVLLALANLVLSVSNWSPSKSQCCQL